MADDLLQTKLFVPSLRPSFVPRPRLIETLESGLHRKMTLISAPAGFGKTTLVTEWIAACKRPFAWLALDKRDGDLNRFLAYVVAALQTVAPSVGLRLQQILQNSPQPSTESLLTMLLNDIAHVPQPFVLVLDDYHLVESPSVDQALTFLLSHLPQQLHLVMTTREDPQLPLSRLRVRGQLTEVRAADLRFVADETAVFLNKTMRLALTAEEMAALENRTEGWIAGLQLAALSIQGRPDTHSFITAFSGDNRFVVDYLVDEVLQRQPPAVRRFLLQTAILQRLCGELCAAVTGEPASADLLEMLERGNLFVIPLDDLRQWYRYHHLFADVLQAYARLEFADQIPIWHRRASDWFAEHGYWAEAVQHALATGDHVKTAAVVELVWPIIPKGIRPTQWLSWVKELPEKVVRRRPVLSAAHAWMSLDIGDLAGAERYLSQVDWWLHEIATGASAEPMISNRTQFSTLPGTTAIAHAYLAQARGELSAVMTHAQRALELLAEDEHYWRGNAGILLGMAQWATGLLFQAHRSIADSVAAMRQANNLYFQIYGLVLLANIETAQGQLHQAHSYYKKALELAERDDRRSGRAWQVTANLFIGLGNLYREWGELETAVSYLTQGQLASERALMPGSQYYLKTMVAQLKESQQDYEAALALLDEAEWLQPPPALPEFRPLAARKARVWLRQGLLAQARRWATQHNFSLNDPLSFPNEFEQLTFARVKLAEFEAEQAGAAGKEAIAWLTRLLEAAKTADRQGSVIKILVLLALGYQVMRENAAAVETIQEATSLAEPAGYVHLFADEGLPMRALLVAAQTPKKPSAYLARLIERIDQQIWRAEAAEKTAVSNQQLIEPLSQRELEVLNLIANGYSNRAVADELVIALSTVKKHVNNIFGKLNVASRTQAANRARELNIL